MGRPMASMLFAALAMAASGCAVNAVRELRPGGGAEIRAGEAVIVYGAAVEGSWAPPRFAVTVARYDADSRELAGNCFRYDRAQFSVRATQREIRRAAYSVPAGHYVYAPFNAASITSLPVFEVPEGQVVYLGDFVLGHDRVVELRRNLPDARRSMAQTQPALASQLSVAKSSVAEAPVRAFLCTP